MSKEHLTYFKVENFKRFDSLELTDIGQFNLIVGDNNVGKTSLLESLQVSLHGTETMYNYHKTLGLRGIDLNAKRIMDLDGNVTNVNYPNENYLDYLLKDKARPLVVNFKILHESDDVHIDDSGLINFNLPGEFEFRFIKEEGRGSAAPYQSKIVNTVNEVSFNLHQDDLNNAYQNRYLPIVMFRPKKAEDIFNDFQKSIGKSRKLRDEFIGNLKFILPKIEEIQSLEISGVDVLSIGLKGEDEFTSLNSFGEGTQRTFEILIEILKNKNARLFIDEVDTGIHYKRLKSLLKTIVNLALANDVQLFLTTHSLECQQAFAEVFEDQDMVGYQTKARQFTLIEQPDGQVKAIKRDWGQLEFALQTDNDTRGGKQEW
ncbi:MAG: AAA family ATPase [Saprospiraceae bacterium]|nr:AAA family ATPase [Saprospiraceae bacterium]